ncbi:hypothetical protein [Hydrogenobacter thermophilus]|uniref:hypothetical protein n=1 Tax=Hydrogenobacter thermophilus TaxID=940 RepID=UPI0030F83278
MPRYAQLTDIKERIAVIEEDLLYADSFIDNLLKAKNLPVPADPPFPDILKQLAIFTALYRACIRLAQAEDTTLIEKAKFYKQEIDNLSEMLSPSTLGIQLSTSITSARMERS